MESRGNSPDGTKIILRGELNIERVLEVREKLLTSLQRHAATQIDVREASEIDPGFLQLLCSAHRTAAGLGKKLTVLGLGSSLLRQQLRESGFIRHTGCVLDCGQSCIWAGDERCP